MTDERERLARLRQNFIDGQYHAIEEAFRADAAEIAALHSRLEAAEKDAERMVAQIESVRELIGDWRDTAEHFDDDLGEQYAYMADALDAALASTPPGTGGDQPVCVGQREGK